MGRPTVPGRSASGVFTAMTGLVSVRPYPSRMSSPAASKNSLMSFASGRPAGDEEAQPAADAVADLREDQLVGDRLLQREQRDRASVPATRWAKARGPTPIAQRKTFCRAGGSDATFSRTRAYIFS